MTRLLRALRRHAFRAVVLGAVPLLVLGGAAWMYIHGGRYITSENAYVKTDIVNISPVIDGRIIRVLVTDNQIVEAGELLFEIDPEPYGIALTAAEAELASVRQRIYGLRAHYRQGEREIAAQQERIRYLTLEFKRQEKLKTKGIGSGAKFEAAEHDLAMARQRIEALRERNRMVLADLSGDVALPIEQHPLYLQAMAKRDRAAFDLSHSAVRAPIAGALSHVALEVGEYVEAGDSVFALVASGAPWIEVNLKEIHLTYVRVGQMATVVVDAYPDERWNARVESISPATGAEFALLPPQNATGNWVKVVQRVPLRLVFVDPRDTSRLRAGMTVTVSIDTERERDLASVIGGVFAGTPDTPGHSDTPGYSDTQ